MGSLPPLISTVYGAVPPSKVASMDPLSPPKQLGLVTLATTLGFQSVTKVLSVHTTLSLNVTVKKNHPGGVSPPPNPSSTERPGVLSPVDHAYS